MPLSIITHRFMITRFTWCNDTQKNNNQYNDNLHNGTLRHSITELITITWCNDIRHKTLSITTISIIKHTSTTVRIMTLYIMTFSIRTLIIIVKGDTRYNINVMLSVAMEENQL